MGTRATSPALCTPMTPVAYPWPAGYGDPLGGASLAQTLDCLLVKQTWGAADPVLVTSQGRLMGTAIWVPQETP